MTDTAARDAIHCEYILDSIALIEDAVNKYGQDNYNTDWIFQSAILRKLHTLSESASKLSDYIKHEYPQIDWQKIYGFRNALVHGYLGDIDDITVWNVINYELPKLKECLTNYKDRDYGQL